MKIQNGISLKPPAPEAREALRDQQLRDAAQMYENHFLNEMVKAMRSTVHREGGLIKENFAEKIFTGQLDQQYVDNWSKKGGVGLADMIYTQIKDRYTAQTKRDFSQPKQALPISPKQDGHGLKAPDSIQMNSIPSENGARLQYRFEVQDPLGAFEAQAPMPGKVAGVSDLGEGWRAVRLDHGQGLKSELTFPGRLAEIGTGTEVQAGQRLGELDSTRPVLAWNLDWT